MDWCTHTYGHRKYVYINLNISANKIEKIYVYLLHIIYIQIHIYLKHTLVETILLNMWKIMHIHLRMQTLTCPDILNL